MVTSACVVLYFTHVIQLSLFLSNEFCSFLDQIQENFIIAWGMKALTQEVIHKCLICVTSDFRLLLTVSPYCVPGLMILLMCKLHIQESYKGYCCNRNMIHSQSAVQFTCSSCIVWYSFMGTIIHFFSDSFGIYLYHRYIINIVGYTVVPCLLVLCGFISVPRHFCSYSFVKCRNYACMCARTCLCAYFFYKMCSSLVGRLIQNGWHNEIPFWNSPSVYSSPLHIVCACMPCQYQAHSHCYFHHLYTVILANIV